MVDSLIIIQTLNRKIMEIRQMKTISHVLIPAFLFLMIGCENSPTESAGMSDADLIDAIRSASKVDIPINDMPSQSQSILENDNEYDALSAKKASDLGYEVNLAGRGHRSGDRNEFYFNLEGRKLDPHDYGRYKGGWDGDEDDKKDWKCFDLVLPVTFDMPDGSTITVTSDDEAGWSEMKAWYEANPDVEEKPAMQYPVDINFDEDRTITINNEEEVRSAYSLCRRGSDEDGFDCGEIVFPVTYVMPDGSVITIENESGYQSIRDWQDTNPDAEGEPTIHYPVDMTFRDEEGEITITINSDEEYRAAQVEYCSQDD
jgi:hypothetical protein